MLLLPAQTNYTAGSKFLLQEVKASRRGCAGILFKTSLRVSRSAGYDKARLCSRPGSQAVAAFPMAILVRDTTLPTPIKRGS